MYRPAAPLAAVVYQVRRGIQTQGRGLVAVKANGMMSGSSLDGVDTARNAVACARMGPSNFP
jgi:hypothetical protein